jgi:hypothetical protein
MMNLLMNSPNELAVKVTEETLAIQGAIGL